MANMLPLPRNLWFLWRARSEAICQFKFVADFRSLQVFPQMGQALFERQQCSCYSLGVRVRDVAPHRIWTGTKPRHLPQRTSADGAKVFIVWELLFDQRTERG